MFQPSSQTSRQVDPTTKHIAEELYKKNLELTETNKTLALLGKIDEIILSTVTDIEQIAQQIANEVVTKSDFKAIYILLMNKQDKRLNPLAISFSKNISEIDPNYQRTLYALKIPLNDYDNAVIKAIKEKQYQKTDLLHDIYRSFLTEEACQQIQTASSMKSFYIYPLVVRDEVIGAMIISPKEEKESFFYFQKDLIERLPVVVAIAIDNALLYQKIQQTNIRLKELDKLKDEFVSLASHELRTPMTAIKSYLWMVLNNSKLNLTPEMKSYLEIASQETEHLLKLVQNMLTISRIEGKRLELNIEPLNVYELVKHAYNTLKIKSKEKHIVLTLLPYPENLLIDADKEKLAEVFENIIGNALKYTPNNGTVSIYFSVERRRVGVHVSDTGPGIAKENLSKLFQKFGRLEETKKTRTPGTGLGLYISKQLVELHKGSIKIESELGKGSTFTVYLPLG